MGTPESIADELESWFANEGADGFNIMPPHLPGGLTDFIDLVLPELRRRGCSAPSTKVERCARTSACATAPTATSAKAPRPRRRELNRISVNKLQSPELKSAAPGGDFR